MITQVSIIYILYFQMSNSIILVGTKQLLKFQLPDLQKILVLMEEEGKDVEE